MMPTLRPPHVAHENDVPAVQPVDADWLGRRISGSRSRDVRRSIAELIEHGDLPPGSRLPTVRDLAAVLDVSLGSVAGAWAELRRDGLVLTRGRSGTVVAAIDEDAHVGPTDLRLAAPDPRLLPDIRPAMSALALQGRTNGTSSTVSELRRSGQRHWPYRAPSFLAASSVRSAFHLIVQELLAPNTPIATVDPLCLRTADVLRSMGTPIITVAEDEHGPLPDSLEKAVLQGAGLFCFEPTLAVPTGRSVGPERLRELAAVIRRAPHQMRVFEEDAAGALGGGLSLGTELPDRVLRAASYARMFGSDLGIALLAGPKPEIARLARLQAMEGVRVGGLVQRLLARLLVDRSLAAGTRSSARIYRSRNASLRDALLRTGVEAEGEGFYLWVPVAHEARAVAALATRGVRVTAGSLSRMSPSDDARIRVATTLVPDAPEAVNELAGLIADASRRASA